MKFRFLVMLALSGCASTTFKSPVMTSVWDPPAGQSCELGSMPPPVSVMVDSAALATALGGMNDLKAGQFAVFSLDVDSTGIMQAVHIVEGSIPESRSTEIENMILKMARRQDNRVDALLRVDIADPIRLSAGPAEECPPSIRNRRRIAELLAERRSELATLNPLLLGETYTAIVSARVNTDGAVEEVFLVQSSGERSVDRAALDVAPKWEFNPATLNRQPVAVWVKVPINFHVRPGRSSSDRGPGE